MKGNDDMLNQVIVLGRLRKVVDLGDKAVVTIANTRPYKNTEGEYKEDLIDFIIFGHIKESLVEYCRQGDIIAIHGRIQTRNEEVEKITELVADKISFLSASKQEDIKDEQVIGFWFRNTMWYGIANITNMLICLFTNKQYCKKIKSML